MSCSIEAEYANDDSVSGDLTLTSTGVAGDATHRVQITVAEGKNAWKQGTE